MSRTEEKRGGSYKINIMCGLLDSCGGIGCKELGENVIKIHLFSI